MHMNISSRTPIERVVLGSSTNRGHQSLAYASSTGHWIPMPTKGLLPLKENPFLELSPLLIKGEDGIVSLFI